jgi:hypothetical protein
MPAPFPSASITPTLRPAQAVSRDGSDQTQTQTHQYTDALVQTYGYAIEACSGYEASSNKLDKTHQKVDAAVQTEDGEVPDDSDEEATNKYFREQLAATRLGIQARDHRFVELKRKVLDKANDCNGDQPDDNYSSRSADKLSITHDPDEDMADS